MSSTNPIEFAINRLTMTMPRQILEMAFFPAIEHRTTDATNLNQRIRELLIEPIVMTDLNNAGGVAIPLDIQQSWITMISPVISIVDVPKNITQNRRITSALNSTFGVNSVNSSAIGIANQGNQTLTAANRVFNSAKTPPYVGTPDVRVVGNNQLEVRNFVSIPVRMRGLIRIEYSRDFTELRTFYWKFFTELVELAVQAYCYNNLLADMDRAFLQGGVEMGRISSKVEEWSDSHKTYADQLVDRWNRILILNDPILSQRNIKMIVNP